MIRGARLGALCVSTIHKMSINRVYKSDGRLTLGSSSNFSVSNVYTTVQDSTLSFPRSRSFMTLEKKQVGCVVYI